MSIKSGLLTEQVAYKPFRYPWAYNAWKTQQQIHWLADEVPLSEDVNDWKHKLTDTEKNLLTQIFRFFVQSDVEVSNCYHKFYMSVFKPTEVLMMLSAFNSTETIHIDAYAHLIDTLGLPEAEYNAFLEYSEMKDKHDFMRSVNIKDNFNVAKTMGIFGGFVEGLALFASFAMLLNWQRFNKLKGVGQIIAWSVRDETLHCNSIIKLFHAFVQENNIDKKKLHKELTDSCKLVVAQEDKFIDLTFKLGPVEGMSANDIKSYIRYIANLRLSQLGIKEIYDVKVNPLPWLDEQLNAVEHMNFFEGRATEYSKAATTGDWDDAFGDDK